MQRTTTSGRRLWAMTALAVGLGLAVEDTAWGQSKERSQGEGPAPTAFATESAAGPGSFRASKDKPALTPTHPPLDQVPPMPMPVENEGVAPRSSAFAGSGLVYNTKTRKAQALKMDFPASGASFGAGGGYDGADGARGSEERPATMSGGMSIIANPGRAAAPWRMNVKLLMRFGASYFVCSGTMRDFSTVLTAGHCVYDFGGSGWADEIWVYPAWDGVGVINPPPTIANHYGWAHSTNLATTGAWFGSGDLNYDMGLVSLDRSVGALTGWFGWAWGFDCGFWTSTGVHNAAYPSEGCGSPGLHNGRDMTYWFGNFDSCVAPNRLQLDTVPGCYNAIWGGMSGSGVYYIDGGNRYVHGITSTSDRATFARYARQTEDWVNYTDATFIPTYGRGPAFDVEPLDVSGPAAVPAGTVLSGLTHLAVNGGNTGANGIWTLRVYLSSNDNIDTADTLLSTQTLNWNFGAASSVSVNMAGVAIPASTPPGNYFVGVIYDNGTDTNSVNNDSDGWDAHPLQVTKPDLDITALSGPATAVPGSGITISNTVQNIGNAAAGAFRVGLYVSADATCTTGDTFLGSRSLASLAAGASSAANTVVTIPAATPLGARFLCGIADDQSAVAETSEANNTFAAGITIVQADLDITSVTGPGSASPGTSFNVGNTVQNVGTNSAGAFRVGIYLSTDNVCTTADSLLASRNLASLAAGASSSANTPVTLPGSTTFGTRYLCAIADDLSAVGESNEANNTGFVAVNVVSATPVITLKVNGTDAAAVNTTGPYKLTLGVGASTYTASVDWYWGLVVNGTLNWVTSTGLSPVPAPLVSAVPAAITDATLLDTTLPTGTNITNVFFMLNGGTIVASDVISTTVVP